MQGGPLGEGVKDDRGPTPCLREDVPLLTGREVDGRKGGRAEGWGKTPRGRYRDRCE